MDNITLYFKQGSSDKVYQARIEPKDGKYSVNYEYGRRGSTMVVGTKTVTAVDYAQCKAIYDKLVKEKIAKGYTPGEDGTPYQHTDKTSTGIHCQHRSSSPASTTSAASPFSYSTTECSCLLATSPSRQTIRSLPWIKS
jgi:predicted DNA-binding WGR domain protein